MSGFLELEIYQLAERLANAVCNAVSSWENFHKYSLGQQMVRSADSIGANIAEGYGRHSLADQARFVVIARGSLYETMHWYRLGCDRQLWEGEEQRALQEMLDELAPRLNAYLRSFHRRMAQAKQVR
ncbi:S23 ribosomal protein (plasmid) [Thalassoporum mexicanum PCC 7367]|uniref:four helix bundle protein n=1 Tax=Thalassoporum mexicanum TaxID=3457544 RepID=UPI00029FEE1E|nr:four helix bundle protein [Pseudanabaena sp. PCC 7367]AFY71922.1 S23 ribosomal protein [Pseudanabaena sp. PCC 7367]